MYTLNGGQETLSGDFLVATELLVDDAFDWSVVEFPVAALFVPVIDPFIKLEFFQR